MTLGDFIVKYLGRKVDYDGLYGPQCVDLARQYWKDVWNVPQPEGVVGAQEFYTEYEKKPVEKKHMKLFQCAKKGEEIPAGAVVVFRGADSNPYGHIGICINTDGSFINLLEQDGFKQDGVKISKWPYDRALGWLLKRDAA